MNPATLNLISVILGAIVNFVPKVEEDQVLIKQWAQFCKTIIDEKRDPTAEEETAALAFAQGEHAQAQAST